VSMATVPLIPDIFEEHVEELEFLWGRRQDALDSPRSSARHLRELDGRIDAHVEGLLLAGERLVPLLRAGLSSNDPSAAFAVAYPLLRLDRPEAADLVLRAFLRAEGGQLEGLRQALCQGPVSAILGPLRAAARSSEPRIGLSALHVLACQSPSECSVDRVERFLLHRTPELRRDGWRVAALLKQSLPPRRYEEALGDEDPQVRSEALWAAAWARQQGILDRCRLLIASSTIPAVDPLRFLAVLGSPDDLDTIRNPRWAEYLGASWFDVLGSSGHPKVIEDLIRGMEHINPRLAVAAGAAFTRITGGDVDSETRVCLPPEDGYEPDAFEEEFLDEAFLPDAAKAREIWEQRQRMGSRGLRWCRGEEVSGAVALDLLDRVDLRSRREICLRAHFEARWDVEPFVLERFPQRASDLGALGMAAPSTKGIR